VKQGNLFGKSLRSRVDDILSVFKQRYLKNPELLGAPVTLPKEDEQDTGEGSAIVDARPAALGLGRLLGQQRFDRCPQFVCNDSFAIPSSYPPPVLLGVLRQLRRVAVALTHALRAYASG
jgi:hypothetical protein